MSQSVRPDLQGPTIQLWNHDQALTLPEAGEPFGRRGVVIAMNCFA
jgi:hypothetical protein